MTPAILPPPAYVGRLTDVLRFSNFSIGWSGSIISLRAGVPCEILDQDTLDYLNDRAKELGVSFDDAYNEEMAARQELAKIMPSYEEAVLLAKLSPAPQQWYDE